MLWGDLGRKYLTGSSFPFLCASFFYAGETGIGALSQKHSSKRCTWPRKLRVLVFSYLFSIFETLDGGHDGPASPDGATPRDGLKVNSNAFRPEDAKQIHFFQKKDKEKIQGK